MLKILTFSTLIFSSLAMAQLKPGFKLEKLPVPELPTLSGFDYPTAKEAFESLQEPTVKMSQGEWKMMGYAFSKTPQKRYFDQEGMTVGGNSNYSQEYLSTLQISYASLNRLFGRRLSKPVWLTRMVLTTASENGLVTTPSNFFGVGPDSTLPKAKTASGLELHCKSIEQYGETLALLCQQRGLSSGSVYYSCYAPAEQTEMGACNLK